VLGGFVLIVFMSQELGQLIIAEIRRACSTGVNTGFPVRALISLSKFAKKIKRALRDSRAFVYRGVDNALLKCCWQSAHYNVSHVARIQLSIFCFSSGVGASGYDAICCHILSQVARDHARLL
jgi:hypothetical protein